MRHSVAHDVVSLLATGVAHGHSGGRSVHRSFIVSCSSLEGSSMGISFEINIPAFTENATGARHCVAVSASTVYCMSSAYMTVVMATTGLNA